jgi:two-component system chemotaxis response regulator CheY
MVVDLNSCWWISTMRRQAYLDELYNSRGFQARRAELDSALMLLKELVLKPRLTRAEHDQNRRQDAIDVTHTRRGAMSDALFGASTGNGRVLVVDDEPDIRKVVRMTLQKAGYDVLEAENGEKAIEVINTGENRLMLDVLVCDIRMPKINGVEAIAYFRKNYKRVPIIVLTGFPDTEMAAAFLRDGGIVDYLVKPVEGEKLKSAVARAMEQREVASL